MGTVSSKGPPNDGRPSRRSWRGGGKTEPARPKRGSSQPSWAAWDGARPGGVRRWMAGVFFTLCSLALLFGFLYFVFLWPRATPLVCLYVTGYEPPLPPQAFAAEDIDRFSQLFYSSGWSDGPITTGRQRNTGPLKATTGEELLAALLKRLNEAQPGGPNKDVMLLYVSAQGVVDPQGRPCLLAAATTAVQKGREHPPAPAEVLAPERLLPVETLLEKIKAVHRGAWKVVLIDAVRSDRNWRLGIAENLFADKLPTAIEALSAGDRVVVINSCGAGEIGIADPVHERTLFGEFVARGLWGEADTGRDGKITLEELAGYLDKQVNATAQRRGRLQQPQLLWSGQESLKGNPPGVVLARAQSKACPPRTPGGSMRQRLINTAARWQELPAMRQGQISASMILPLEQARQELLRFETLLAAGKGYEEWTKTEPKVSGLRDLPSRRPAPSVSLPLSLPGSVAWPAADQLRAWGASFGPVPKDQPDPVQKLEPHQRLLGIWSALHDPDHPTPPEQLFERAELTDLDVLPVELRTWLRFSPASAFLPPSIQADDSAKQAFAACREGAERAASALGDPRASVWIAPLVEQGDRLRRQAEDRAFAGGGKAQLLSQLAEAFHTYDQAGERAAEVSAALALRDRALAELPYWLEWTCVGDASRVQLGHDLIAQVAALQSALDSRDDVGAAYPSLIAAKDILQGTLKRLDAALDEMTENCASRSVHLGYLVELEQLLAGPLVNAADRPRLWEAYFDVLARETADADSGASRAAAVKARGAAGELLKAWLASQDDPQQFAALAQAARAETNRQDEDFTARGPELRQELRRADGTIRRLSPWLSLAGVRSLGGRHAAVLHEEAAWHDYYCWQARRFLDDFQASGDDLLVAQGDVSLAELAGIRAGGDPYFAVAAGKLLDAAAELFPKDPATTRELLASRLVASRQLIRHVNQPLRTSSAETVPSDRTTVTLPIQPLDADAIAALPAGLAALRAAEGDLAVDNSGLKVAVHADEGAPAAENSPLEIPGRWSDRMPPSVLPPQFTIARREEPWKFDFYYRGHVGEMRYEFAPLQPGHVIASRRSGDTGRVMVASHRTKGSVVIVLDCSKSMLGDRFKDARHAVEVTIADLLRSEGMYVSLVAFGHRRSIDREATRNAAGRWPLKWNNLFGPNNPAVTLTNDFDEVWNSSQERPNLEATEKLQPMGATPLYDAISYAVAHAFPAGTKSRHLIVVTDGRDSGPSSSEEQADDADDTQLAKGYDPPWDGLYNRRDRREARERAAAKAVKDARLESMLLFDLTGTQELKDAAEALGAELISIEETATLSEKILQNIGIFRYRIAERGQLRQEATTAKSEIISLPLAQYTLEPAGNSTAKVPFEIRGDEALSVRIDRGQKAPRISFLDFDEAARGDLKPNLRLAREEAERLAGDPLFPAEYHVSCVAERFVVGKKNRQFEVTLRSVEAGRFTPRPREVWVEVVPAQKSGAEPARPMKNEEPYFFLNPSFKADTPVPVLVLDAPNWPADANAAVVSVLLRMSESAAGGTLTEDGQMRPASLARNLGIKFDWRIEPLPDSKGWAIRVSEQHTAGGPDAPGWCYVELDRSRADSVTRRFYPANGLVEHDFEFAGVAPETLSRRAVRIVPSADWKKTAAAAEPLTVSVPLQ